VKRLTLTAGLALAVVLPGTAQALSHREAVAYGRAYAHVEHALGHGTAGCKLIGPASTCRHETDSMVRRSTDTLHRMLAPAPVYHHAAVVASTTTATGSNVSYSGGGGGYGDVPGVPPGFASCVAMRESTNGAGSSNIYGILGAGGQGSIAEQKQAFAQMYAARGTEPWSPYDGC
jgi:hypothetical protein